MKKLFIIISILLIFVFVSGDKSKDSKDSDWLEKAVRNIESKEYNITYNADKGYYVSPNRANDLKIYYLQDGFSVYNRKEDRDWNISINLINFGKEDPMLWTGGSFNLISNSATVANRDMEIEYINSKKGMRQNFLVKRQFEGEGDLILRFEVTGNNSYKVDNNKVIFRHSNHIIMEYRDLNVYDSNGRMLNASFKKTSAGFSINVDDKDAVYPIYIDPLSTNPDWVGSSNQSGANFGYGTSTAGDVNGDGFSDIIIGAYGYDNGQSNEGAVFVYYGSPDGLSETYDWMAESNSAGANFGYKVSTAGDVNGDGFSDVIIGALHYSNGQSSEGAAFVYHGSPSGLSDTYDWKVESNQAGACYGISVATAGDVNGDGYSDVVVGAYLYTDDQNEDGAAFVYYGSPEGLSTTHDWMTSADQEVARYGRYVSCAGDVNGDGYSDIIVSHHYYTGEHYQQGAAYVFHGSQTGLSTTYDWMAKSNQGGSHFGTGVASAGDINGDGFSDVVIDANRYSNPEYHEGAAFVYYGSNTGLSSDYVWMYESNEEYAKFGWSGVCPVSDINCDGYSDLIIGGWLNGDGGEAFVFYGSESGLNNSFDWKGESDEAGAWYGVDVSTAGDVNGDGYTDLMVGASRHSGGGKVYIYYGHGTGLGDTTDVIYDPDQSYARFGISVSTAGDVNGDGYTDVIIGADKFDNGETDEGAAFVYYGTEAGLDTIPSWSGESDQDYANYGISVSTAGDVNNDGFSDIIVGANAYDDGETDEGAVFLYYGSQTGLSSNYNWLGQADQDSAGYGTDVSYAGDVNGDGYSDIVIGANRYDNGETDEGAAFVYYGSDTGLSSAFNWSAEIDQGNANFGISAASAGDINGDGYSDIIIGADKYDNGQTDEGAVFVYYGSDTGLPISYNWSDCSGQAASGFGISVSTAGDVNGDGFSDVIVGASDYDNNLVDEGAAFVYHGSSAGLIGNSEWMESSDQSYSKFGRSVSTSGDVNGDGYSDVIVGAYLYDDKKTNQGAAFVYYGNETGLDTFYHWYHRVNQEEAWYGYNVSLAGYVTGNGFSDAVVGAPYYDNGETDEGSVFMHYGNKGAGPYIPKQMRSDGSVPIVAPLNVRDNAFRISLIGKDFIGTGKIKLQWEVKPINLAFDGTGLCESADWIDTDSRSVAITENVTGLIPNTAYKWRVRIKYDMTTGTPQPHGRWYYISDNAPHEMDLKTGGTTSINQIKINSTIENTSIVLTINGIGDKYLIEKQNESGKYVNIGQISGSTFTDDSPVEGFNNYRITQYNNEMVSNRVEIIVYFSSPKHSISDLYFSINLLNEEIESHGLTVYDINGRKINRIQSVGTYYLVKEHEEDILEKKKIIFIR